MTETRNARAPPLGLWVITLGAVGFCAGFFGPIALNPEANQGPLLGLFITGPIGLLAGIVLGAAFRWLPVSTARRWQALLAANVALLFGTLYYCLPQPATHGYLVQGTLARCQATGQASAEAIRYWDDRIAGAPWAKVRDGWKDELPALVASHPAVVLTIDVRRENRIVRHRKPWNRGRIGAEGWHDRSGTQRYFAAYDGGSCAAYRTGLPVLFVPYGQHSSAWPPDDLPGLLHLARIERAPDRYLEMAK
jgi:hypothetical protein